MSAAVARHRRPGRRRRLIAPLALVLAGLAGSPVAVDAAIHEKVAAICANGEGHQLEPPGQLRAGDSSFLRALQASGLYELRFGVEPDGTPNPRAVTIDVDFEAPASKYADAGFYVSFEDAGLLIFLRAGIPDHPAFARCARLAGPTAAAGAAHTRA